MIPRVHMLKDAAFTLIILATDKVKPLARLHNAIRSLDTHSFLWLVKAIQYC